MNWPDIFLFAFVTGSLWSVVSLALGGLHGGHAHGHAAGAHLHGHGGHAHHVSGSRLNAHSRLFALANPSSAAVFLCWFGAAGYLLTRYSGFWLWFNLAISGAFGLAGALLLASFLRFLQSREKPLNPLDFEMAGVLGQVSSPIRPGGVGEVLYVREGVRRCVPARSEDGKEIGHGREVVVTRFERGIAYVRTWEAMIGNELSDPGLGVRPASSSQGEHSYVE